MINRQRLTGALLMWASAHASATTAAQDMAELSLEQLSNIVVTSVARKETRLSTAPASLYIITANAIGRSGARSLPEALRLAPNLQVARSDARSYAITARGFNTVLENKLLVLIDGRSVYSPLFSGVFWDAQDVVLADVARIEVISGPGATIWGANAVNGVINIITRSAADTEGTLARAYAGEHEHGATVRRGGALGAGGHYRVYFKADEIDDGINAAGARLSTGLRRHQGGFRADWRRPGGGLTISGDAYQGKLAAATTRDTAIEGANLLARHTSKPGPDSDLRLQVVLDHTQRDQANILEQQLNTIDLEAQHGIRLAGGHNVVWGGGYRHSRDRLVNGPRLGFLPAALNMYWGNLFAQDEFDLAAALRLTAGVKFEQNNYTGVETLPNLRLAWTPGEARLVWGSLSRTVRAPSRIDRDFFVPINPNAPPLPGLNVAGGPDFVSETANVAELGYRAQPTPALSYSATVYFSDYDRLRTLEPRAGLASQIRNQAAGRTRGLELWSRWQVRPSWRLNGGLVLQSVKTRPEDGSLDPTATTGLSTNDPRLRWMLRSSHDLGDAMQLELILRHVGRLPLPAVPAYRELDVHWRWTPRRHIELALTGQNLLHRSHPEFGSAPGRSVFERSILLSAALRF